MENLVKKLQEYTDEVKLVVGSLYREGSAESVGIRNSEIVNTLATLDVVSKLEKLIEVETENGKKLDELLKKAPSVEVAKAPTKTTK